MSLKVYKQLVESRFKQVTPEKSIKQLESHHDELQTKQLQTKSGELGQQNVEQLKSQLESVDIKVDQVVEQSKIKSETQSKSTESNVKSVENKPQIVQTVETKSKIVEANPLTVETKPQTKSQIVETIETKSQTKPQKIENKPQIVEIQPENKPKPIDSQSKSVETSKQVETQSIEKNTQLIQDQDKVQSESVEIKPLLIESKQEEDLQQKHEVVEIETKKVEFKDLIKKDDKRFSKQNENVKQTSKNEESQKVLNVQNTQEQIKKSDEQLVQDIKFENVEVKKFDNIEINQAKTENKIEEVIVPKISNQVKVESTQSDLSQIKSELEQSGVVSNDRQTIQYEEPQIIAHHDTEQNHEQNDFFGIEKLFSSAKNYIKHFFGLDQKNITEQRWKSVKDAEGNQIYYQDNFHYGKENEVRQAPKEKYILKNPQARVFLLSPEKSAGTDELVTVFNPIKSKQFTSTVDRTVIPNPTF